MKRIALSLLLAMLMVLSVSFAFANGSITDPETADLGDLVNGELNKDNLSDFYSVDMDESGLLTLAFDAQCTRNRFTLYDEKGYQLWTAAYDWNSEDGQSNKIVQWHLVSGTYVLCVSPDTQVESANVRAYGSYEFRFTAVSANEEYEESIDSLNNSFATASGLEDLDGSAIKGQIALNDIVDFYQFDFDADDLILDITSKTAKQVFTLYNHSGNVVFTKDMDAVNNVITLSQRFSALEHGHYYFSVGYISGKKPESQGNYTMKLTAHNHDFAWVITQKATPTADGVESNKCKDKACGFVKETRAIAKPYAIKLEKTDWEYTGSVIKPAVIVLKDKNTALSKKYYSIKRMGGKTKVGTYTVKVTLKGDYYTGSVNLTFDIFPVQPAIKLLVPGKKQMEVQWTNVYNKQIEGYEIEYSTDRAFKANHWTEKVTDPTKTKTVIKRLVSGKKYYVRIRSYKHVGNTVYYSPVSKVKTTTVK